MCAPKRQRGNCPRRVSCLDAIDRLGGLPKTRDEVRDAFWKVFPRDKSDEARRGAFFRGIEALELVEDARGDARLAEIGGMRWRYGRNALSISGG